jgi:hypothetical protein
MHVKLPALFRHIAIIAALLLLAGTTVARAQDGSAASAADPAMLGAWTVTAAADPNDVGLRFFFSPDGTFLMVNPRLQIGAAGSWLMGRTGLIISLYSPTRSAHFMQGEVSVQGDNMVIDVKRSGAIAPQKVKLQRMRLQ